MKKKLKIVLDFLMPLLLLFLMGYQFFDDTLHEIVGLAEFAIFIIHHIVNANWYKNLFKGKYNATRIVLLVTDVLVFVSMIMEMYSGIVLSKHVFSFLSISSGMALARRIHILGAYWGFVLMSFHLGLHLNYIFNAIHINAKKPAQKIAGCVFSIVVSCYGLYSLFDKGIIDNLFLKNEFVFVSQNESKTMFYIAYIAAAGLFVIAGNFLAVAIKHKIPNSKK